MKRVAMGLLVLTAIGLQLAWLVFSRPDRPSPERAVPGDGSMEAAAAAMPRSVDVTSPQFLKLEESSRIATTASTFDEAVAALEAPLTGAQRDLLSYAGDSGGGMFLDRTFAAALADHRLARMYEILRELPTDAAREQLRALFERKLDDWSRLWAKFAPFLHQDRHASTIMDMDKHYQAIAICVVLSGALLPKQEAVDWCLAWGARVQREMRNANFDLVAYEQRIRDRLRDAYPSPEFQLNFHLWLAQRHGCPFQQIDSSHAGSIHDGFPVLEERVVTRADWLPDGKPPREEAVLFRAPLLRTWGPFGTPEHQARALARARQLLSDCP
jgi:hypothetical protein